MSRRKTIAVLVAGAAALAVAGGGAALAASDVLSPEERSKAVIDDAADQLGVEPSELTDALKDAWKNQIDEAVEAGRLTTEQADALKERIDSADVPLFFGGFGHRGFGLGPPHDVHLHSLETAASFLGLTEAELRAELEDGKSLADVAKAEGKSVSGLVQALVAAAEERLAQAVEDGKLTQAQADELRGDLDERITDLVNREPGAGRGFRHHHFGAGPDQFGGGLPWSPGPRA